MFPRRTLKARFSMKRTRQNILEQAAAEFSAKGYSEASTREILLKAKANIASINYYFGSKEALYAEVLNRVRNRFADAFAEISAEYAVHRESGADQKSAENLIKKMIKILISLACSGDMDSIIYIREYVDPSPAYNEVFGEFNNNFRKMLADLIMSAAGGKLSMESAGLSCMMLISFILSLYTRKNIILSGMSWKSYDDAAREIIFQTVCRSLNLD